MKILVVHNDYGQYSGEEAVVDQFIADYREHGYMVEVFRRSSSTSRNTLRGKIHGFFSGIYSVSGVRTMKRILLQYRPDVVHIHNLYPFISPPALFTCHKAEIPVVMTVHNYRLMCPTGLFLRDGHPCEACLQHHSEWRCLWHNCEKSLLRSLGYAARNTVARQWRIYTRCVDYFCCLTNFQQRKLAEYGIDTEKLRVFPNYINISYPPAHEMGNTTQERFVGYVGRLSYEKGYDLLLEIARRHPEIPFRLAGTFREGNIICDLPNVTLCGPLDKEHLSIFYQESAFIVIPSRCYEGFPMVLLEASIHKKPCIAPNQGAFPELIHKGEAATGLLFAPGDIENLEQQVVKLWNNPEQIDLWGAKAYHNVTTYYNKAVINAQWFDFIESIAIRKHTQKT